MCEFPFVCLGCNSTASREASQEEAPEVDLRSSAASRHQAELGVGCQAGLMRIPALRSRVSMKKSDLKQKKQASAGRVIARRSSKNRRRYFTMGSGGACPIASLHGFGGSNWHPRRWRGWRGWSGAWRWPSGASPSAPAAAARAGASTRPPRASTSRWPSSSPSGSRARASA